MKVLVVLSAVVAMAVAKPGYLGLGAARAIAAAPAVAYSAAPAVTYSAPAVAYSAGPAVVAAAPVHPGYAAYGPANIVIGADGTPLDTPEVAATKAAHLNAVAETRARDAIVNSAAVVAAAAPVAASAPAIAAAPTVIDAYSARAIAAPAVIAARTYAAPAAVAYSAVHPGYAAYGPANIVIGPNGVPLDTPEVAAGKVADAVAHLEAKARNGVLLG